MEILVTYDVMTDSPEGRRRLRRVAKVCEKFGQRVQYSVFECMVNAAQFEQLKAQLKKVIEPDEDSLRLYRLQEPRSRFMEVLGKELTHDQHNPLIF
jgi:CRISPR-associated protein Cas2